MKKSSLLISSLLLIPCGILFFAGYFSETKNVSRSYKTTELASNVKAKSWNDAAELLHSLYKDEATGEVDYQQLRIAKQQALNLMMQKAGAFTFVEEGPDNVGGRTRGLAVHPSNDDVIYAGSVTGGLFVSTNAGNSWNKVDGFDAAVNSSVTGNGSISISSIAITTNGTIYIATGGGVFEGGLSFEGSGVSDGDGIWYSTDDGLTFQQISGTNNMDITKVVADYSEDNVVYYSGSSQGVKKITDLGAPVAVTGVPTTTTGDVKVSIDGQVIITGVAQGGQRTWVSQDGGSTWTDLHSNGQIVGSGAGRSEYAISTYKNANGEYSLYCALVTSSGSLKGVYRSTDNGSNWCQIGPSSTTGFAPFGDNSQGLYDCVIAAHPSEDGCILGGIDLWTWTHTPGSSCDNGQWEVVSNWAANPQSPFYIHADNHRITFNSQGKMYVGNDGGVQTTNLNNYIGLFSVVNKGYNVTQFYGIAYGGDGSVMGGAQDNGTQLNDHTGISPLEFREVNGGDGFECEISYLSSEAIISTIYNGVIERSNDRGLNWQSANAPCSSAPGLGSGCGPFYNSVRLFEDGMDMDTQDSVQYIPTQSMQAGDEVTYYSQSFDIAMQYTLDQDLLVTYDTVIPTTDSVLPNFDTIPGGVPYLYNPIAQDTINLPDYKQSLFATQGEGSIYVTRDMMRFTVNPEWWRLFNLGSPFMNSSAHSYDFSKDGNWLWVGSSNGEIVRVSGLDSAYSFASADYSYRPSELSNVGLDSLIELSNGDTITGTALDNINFDTDGHLYSNMDGSAVEYQLHVVKIANSFGGVITDICVDPSNPNNVCVVTGGTSGTQVWYCTDAGAASPNFSSIDGNLPNMPVFGCVVERDPSTDVIIVGTEYGVYSTNSPSSSASWTAHNEEIGPIPVFDVRQQWRDWESGYVNNPGAIYLGTHARGIWRSDDVLSTQEIQPIEAANSLPIDALEVFPNPMVEEGKVRFDLTIQSDVSFNIYDLTGKVIRSITWKNMSPGTHTMDFNCSKFPIGTYFGVVESAGFNKVAKFVKY